MTEELYERRLKQAWILFGIGAIYSASMIAATFFIGWLILLYGGGTLIISGMVWGCYNDIRWCRERGKML